MKRSKRMLALCAVLAVLCGATLLLTQYEERQEQIRSSDAVVLAIPTDTVESLSWAYTSAGMAFHREEDGWLYDEDEAFPVDGAAIRDILSHFESFGAAFTIESPEDLGQYGLDDPVCTIQLTAAGEHHTIALGDYSKMDQQRYVDIGDGNVYLVSSDPMDYLSNDLSRFIANDAAPSFEAVQSITFTGSEDYTIVMVEDSAASYSADDIYFARLEGQDLPLDTDAVTNYLNTITALPLTDYATYSATAEELAAYGLDQPELTVSIAYTCTDSDKKQVSDTAVLHIGQNVQELAACQEALAEGEEELPAVTKYVRVGDSQLVYVLDDLDYLTLAAAGYDELRHRELFWAGFDTVKQLDITLEGETHTITAAPDAEDRDQRVWSYGGQETDITAIQGAISSLTADCFTQEAPTGREEIRLTLYLDSGDFPQVDISLYRYDGSLCLAQVDGEIVSLVERSEVMELVEAVQAIVL